MSGNGLFNVEKAVRLLAQDVFLSIVRDSNYAARWMVKCNWNLSSVIALKSHLGFTEGCNWGQTQKINIVGLSMYIL